METICFECRKGEYRDKLNHRNQCAGVKDLIICVDIHVEKATNLTDYNIVQSEFYDNHKCTSEFISKPLKFGYVMGYRVITIDS
jgi:hypothetical protein